MQAPRKDGASAERIFVNIILASTILFMGLLVLAGCASFSGGKERRTVTFDTGNVLAEDITREVVSGEVVGDLPWISTDDPERREYYFKGWFEDAACTEEASPYAEVHADTTYYALWEGREGELYFLQTGSSVRITRISSDVKLEAISHTIPDTINGLPVTEIGKGSFYNCKKLESIRIPDTVHVIAEEAFVRCRSLRETNLPSQLRIIEKNAFSMCESLQGIELPAALEVMGEKAFWGCDSLAEISLPEGLRTVGEKAFAACDNLRLADAALPAGVESWGAGVFYGCDNIAEEIILPDSMKRIPAGFFAGCTSLRRVELPAGAEKIGEDAFMLCEGLGQLHLPDSITEIGKGAFASCSSLEEIELPPALKLIASHSLQWCASLTRVRIPDSVEIIGSNAFTGCIELEELNLPESLKGIGDAAFNHCESLTVLELPERCTYIGIGAFGGCTALEEIRLPSQCRGIGGAAFTGCSSLRHIYSEKDPAPRAYEIPWEKVERILEASGFSSGRNEEKDLKRTFTDIHPEAVLHYPSGAGGYDVSPWTDIPNRRAGKF